MYVALSESVGLFGAEVWGRKREESLDRITRKYLKWILGLDITTPNYILMEKSKVKEMKVKAVRRAIRFEEKAKDSRKELVKECLKERNSEGRRGCNGRWAKERKKMLQEFGIKELNSIGEEEEKFEDVVMNKLRKRMQKIEGSRYNEYYKIIRKDRIPKYLEGRMKKKDRCLIARFRN